MINKNILYIIMNISALNQWKNKVLNINKEYKYLYKFSKKNYVKNIHYIQHCHFYFNYRSLNRGRQHIIYTLTDQIYNTKIKLPKYYYYSNGS